MYFKIIQQNKIKKCLKTRKIENQVGDKQSDKKKSWRWAKISWYDGLKHIKFIELKTSAIDFPKKNPWN